MKKSIIILTIVVTAVIITTVLFVTQNNKALNDTGDYNDIELVNGSQKYITGTIYEMTAGRILVAEGIIEDENLSAPDNFTGNAGWFTVPDSSVMENLELGLMVEVWVSGPVLESYPAQAVADRVVVVVRETTEGAGSLIGSSRTNRSREAAQEDNDEEFTTDANPQPACYTGGCSGEICSLEQEVITTCEMIPGMECLQSAACQFVDGSCRWVLNNESANCFMKVREQHGDEVVLSRIGHLFSKAEEYLR